MPARASRSVCPTRHSGLKRSSPTNLVTQISTLTNRLEALDSRPTPAGYQALAREIGELRGGLRPLKVALLASFTIDPLVPFLRVEAARHGFDADVYVTPFNSVNQALLDPDSPCVRHQPDIVFITQVLEDMCPALSD